MRTTIHTHYPWSISVYVVLRISWFSVQSSHWRLRENPLLKTAQVYDCLPDEVEGNESLYEHDEEAMSIFKKIFGAGIPAIRLSYTVKTLYKNCIQPALLYEPYRYCLKV